MYLLQIQSNKTAVSSKINSSVNKLIILCEFFQEGVAYTQVFIQGWVCCVRMCGCVGCVGVCVKYILVSFFLLNEMK